MHPMWLHRVTPIRSIWCIVYKPHAKLAEAIYEKVDDIFAEAA